MVTESARQLRRALLTFAAWVLELAAAVALVVALYRLLDWAAGRHHPWP